MVLSLLFLFPLGLFLMWKFSKWPSLVRAIITVAIVIISLASITYIGQVQMIKPYVANLDSSSESDKSDSITDKDEENHEKAKEQTNGKYQEWFDTSTKGTSDSSSTSSSSSTDDSVTRDQKAALKKAEFYSEYLHSSKKDIYHQLTSEYGNKFSEEDAQYAIDHLKADYNKNALESAKTYAKSLNMSTREIYDQLISEYGGRFTPSEAQYAIDHLDK
ncbi:Ltp family lipoprotein [Staphylococcus schweitzeri]|uniref:Ltp family lipoprotein n=1 Tax=Staphylococcus schweitzeri TaxID=1654388 RepID=UPI001CD316DE|nr:Ltp family lipoprotein [Staphylococcus schweitzeri]